MMNQRDVVNEKKVLEKNLLSQCAIAEIKTILKKLFKSCLI